MISADIAPNITKCGIENLSLLMEDFKWRAAMDLDPALVTVNFSAAWILYAIRSEQLSLDISKLFFSVEMRINLCSVKTKRQNRLPALCLLTEITVESSNRGPLLAFRQHVQDFVVPRDIFTVCVKISY